MMRAPNCRERTFVRVAAGTALAVVAFTAHAAESAPATVYKCAQPDAAVLYADYPCKGSTVVDIKRDVVDPTAVDRLRRAQARYEQAAAERRANEETATLRREEARLRALQTAGPDAEPPMTTPALMYVPAYGFVAPKVHRSIKERPVHRRADHAPIAQLRAPASPRRPQ